MSDNLLFAIPEENKFYLRDAFLDQYKGKQPEWGTLGRVVYLRTYSRLLPDGTNEEFWQTCQRVVNGAYSILKNQIKKAHSRWSDDEAHIKAQEMYERMFAFKWLPPGRGLWAMGTPIIEKMGGMALNNCAARSTKDIDQDFASPFCDLADWSMCGVGVGYDVRGAGKVVIQKPAISDTTYVVEDSREGWVDLIRTTLNPYVGVGALPATIDYTRIRPEGAPLKTFGGVASGYKPLDELRCSIIELLDANADQKITTTVISDIFNMIGKCVVSGNIRRSSEIAMGFPDDAEFIALKDPTPKRELRAKQDEILTKNLAYVAAKNLLGELTAARKKHSVLSTEYTAFTDKIDEQENLIASIFWAADEVLKIEEKINSLPQERWRWASNNSIFADLDKPIPASIVESTVQNGEPGYMWLDIARRYGRLIDPPTDVDQNILLPNPCGEIGLHNSELCNLSELFPTKHETLEDFLATIKVAYLYAKIVTLVPTHNEATNAVIMANRRIGLSMAGVAQMYADKGLQECIRWWDTGYKYVSELDKVYAGWMGVPRSIKKSTLKPGGCRPANAITATDQGLLTLDELLVNHPSGEEWGEVTTNINALQGNDKSKITKTFSNGVADVYRINMNYGLSVESTANHMWFVRATHGLPGNPTVKPFNQWVRTDALTTNHVLDVVLGTYSSTEHFTLKALDSSDVKFNSNAAVITQPDKMSPDLAWLLGYLWGDGCFSPKHRIRFADGHLEHLIRASRIIKETFNIDSTPHQRTAPGRTDYQLEIGCKMLWHWLIQNGMWKYGATGINIIPSAVRRSSREDIIAFLAGLLDSDGCASNDPVRGARAIWTSGDATLSKHVQDIAWAVGLGLGRAHQVKGSSFQKTRSLWHMVIGSSVDAEAFTVLIKHSSKLTNLVNSKEFTHWNWETASKGITVGKIKSIELIGELPTFDIEVENTHWYYAGSIKSHNTVPLLVGVEGGMRFPESRHYVRTIRMDHQSPLVETLRNAGYRVEPDRVVPRTVVVYFPIALEGNARADREVSLWEKAALFTAIQAYWSDNMVSATLTFQPHEAKDVARVLDVYAGRWKGVSFLPVSDHDYAQPPYAEITREEYEEMSSKLKPLSEIFGKVHDKEDKFCDGDRCVIG